MEDSILVPMISKKTGLKRWDGSRWVPAVPGPNFKPWVWAVVRQHSNGDEIFLRAGFAANEADAAKAANLACDALDASAAT